MPSEFGYGRGPLRKIEGKRYPVVGEVVVRLTANVELYDVSGVRFSFPRIEERLEITFERDGKQVAIGKVPLADVIRKLESPDYSTRSQADLSRPDGH